MKNKRTLVVDRMRAELSYPHFCHNWDERGPFDGFLHNYLDTQQIVRTHALVLAKRELKIK